MTRPLIATLAIIQNACFVVARAIIKVCARGGKIKQQGQADSTGQRTATTS